jgi:hypothetical protein
MFSLSLLLKIPIIKAFGKEKLSHRVKRALPCAPEAPRSLKSTLFLTYFEKDSSHFPPPLL